jgi:hypothetical protein
MDTLATRYCRVAWLPSNRGRVFSIGTARCCKGKAIHNSEAVSLWIQSALVHESVSGISA